MRTITLFLCLLLLLSMVGCSREEHEELAPVNFSDNEASAEPANPGDSVLLEPQETEKPQGTSKEDEPEIGSPEFIAKEEDLYAKYEVDQDTETIKGIITDVVYNEAQQKFIIKVTTVVEEYEEVSKTAEDGRKYTGYELNVSTGKESRTYMCTENGTYCAGDPYDEMHIGGQVMSLPEFAAVASGKTAYSEPLIYEISVIKGNVMSAELWKEYYSMKAYERRMAQQAILTPAPYVQPDALTPTQYGE